MIQALHALDLPEFRKIKKNPRFVAETFSPQERRYCRAHRFSDERFAARYAAKRALLEVLGFSGRPPVPLRDLEVVRKPLGPPSFLLPAKVMGAVGLAAGCTIHLSLTHERSRAGAYVVIEPPSRLLTVTADDFNLSRGVSEAILEAHERGIVTNTSFLINYPCPTTLRRRLARAARLSVGLHLNLVRGRPVARRARVGALLSNSGEFSPRPLEFYSRVRRSALEAECRAQIARFENMLGHPPDHLDTHHHIHRHPRVLAVLTELARSRMIPIRHPGELGRRAVRAGQVPFLSDRVWGSLDRAGIWSRAGLLKRLSKLPGGATEVVCHPGFVDQTLKARSSFLFEREKEAAVFRAANLREVLRRRGVWLVSSKVLGRMRMAAKP